jgi:hypothetical protein
MSKEKKGKASTVLLTMSPDKFLKQLQELKDLHGAADDAAMAVASGYKSLKKQGMNLEALKLTQKLVSLGNPAKVAAFLADFDKMRELAGLDAQLALFDEDKTAPQKAAESAKVVDLKTGKAPEKARDQPAAAKPEKPKKAAKTAARGPVTKNALFGTDDGDVAEVSEEEKARQAGMVAGAAGEDYANPHDSGPLRDAWHSGYVAGSESASTKTPEKASA